MKLWKRVESYTPLFKSKKIFITITGLLVVIVALVVLNVKYSVAFQNGRLNFDQKSQDKESELATMPAVEANYQKSDEGSDTKNTKPGPSATNGSDSEQIRYSISSDPRSTAYSTTPPAPNPKSFEIQITRTGQVTPGTLISYNATKGDKTYYAGDLLTSPSNVALPKSCNTTKNVTVTIPNGVVSSMPNEWWSDVSPYVYMAFDSNAATTGTSFSIIVGCNPSAPVGNHRIHIVSGPMNRDNWVYHGFVTVRID